MRHLNWDRAKFMAQTPYAKLYSGNEKSNFLDAVTVLL